MSIWNNPFMHFIAFSKTERNIAILLLLLIAISIITPQFFDRNTSLQQYYYDAAIAHFDSIDRADQLASLERTKKYQAKYAHATPKKQKKEAIAITTEFPFNPNKISEDQAKQLGITAKVYKTMRNYIEKAGGIHSKEQFQKIYNLKQKDINRLTPYLRFSEKPVNKTKYQPKKNIKIFPKDLEKSTYKKYNPKPEPKSIAINSATEKELQAIKGIGPSYSKRIVKYRSLIGGYYNKEQLREVYGMNDTLYLKIESYLVIDTTAIKGINVNIMTAKEMAQHYYIDWKYANRIEAYRQQHGEFANLENLRKIHGIPDSVIQKISPYLRFE